MNHEDEIQPRPAPETPQSVWQALDRHEEPGTHIRHTPDELCARARFRERENILFQWIAAVVCLVFGAACAYGAIRTEQLWMRLGLAWMALLTALALWGSIRVGARRFRAGESCVEFMLRELEGSRRTMLTLQRGMVALLPTLLMFWWGDWSAIQASRVRLLDPLKWRHSLMAILGSIVWCVFFLVAAWMFLGREAKKRAHQAEELRRAIGSQE